ncbi:hypothetical protein, partial [Aeromonas caviae]
KQESGIKRRSSHFSCVNTVPVNTYDYKSLRKFQQKGKMTDSSSEFKPTPIGFTFSPDRK